MMKLFIFSALLVIATCRTLEYTEEPTLDTCQCWPGYKPQKVDMSKVMCAGTKVFALKPCNMGPQPPHCECGPDVTGILSDSTGIWCSTYSNGIELKKWPCENKDEWDAYKIEQAVFEEQHKKQHSRTFVE